MIGSITYKAYKSFHVQYLNAWDKALGFAIEQTTSRNKMRVLNACDDVVQDVRSSITSHQNWGDFIDYMCGQHFAEVTAKAASQVGEAIHRKDMEIKMKKLGLRIVT